MSAAQDRAKGSNVSCLSRSTLGDDATSRMTLERLSMNWMRPTVPGGTGNVSDLEEEL